MRTNYNGSNQNSPNSGSGGNGNDWRSFTGNKGVRFDEERRQEQQAYENNFVNDVMNSDNSKGYRSGANGSNSYGSSSNSYGNGFNGYSGERNTDNYTDNYRGNSNGYSGNTSRGYADPFDFSNQNGYSNNRGNAQGSYSDQRNDVDDIFDDPFDNGSPNPDDIFRDEIPEEVDPLKADLMQAFLELNEAIESSREPESSLSNVETSIDNPYEYKERGYVDVDAPIPARAVEEDNEEPEQSRGISKRLLVGIIAGVLVLGIGGTVAVTNYIHNRDSIVDSDVDILTINNEIGNFYTDDFKTDLKSTVSIRDVEAVRLQLENLEKSSTDADISINDFNILYDELETLELYLKDSSKLNEYVSSDCSYEREDIDRNISTLQDNLRSYTVSGLKTTMSNKISEYLNSRDSYFLLRDELLGIVDPSSYDERVYSERINAVTHTVNRSYLQQISNKLLADKTALEAERAYNEASAEDKEKYKKELEEAQKDKERLESELEEAKKKAKEDTDSGKDESSKKSESSSKATSSKVTSNQATSSRVESKVESKVETQSEEDNESSKGSILDGLLNRDKTSSAGSTVDNDPSEVSKVSNDDDDSESDSGKNLVDKAKDGLNSAKDNVTDAKDRLMGILDGGGSKSSDGWYNE